MHYITNRSSNGTIKSIRVHYDDSDESIYINNKFINELRKHRLLSESGDNEQLISIISNALLLKKNNALAVYGSGTKYKLGNDIDFINKFVSRLSYTLENTCIELLVSFFDSAKVQDLNDFINDPTHLDFI